MNNKSWRQMEQADHRANRLAERAVVAMQRAMDDPAQLATVLGAAEEGKQLNDVCLRKTESRRKLMKLAPVHDREFHDRAMSVLDADLDRLRTRGELFAQALTAIAELRVEFPDKTEPVLGGRRAS